MKHSRLFVLIPFIIFISCVEKNDVPEKHWFKGNLHTHSYWSDGDEFPEVVMDWYKSNDYQFVALTDHNTLAEGNKWKVIAKDSIYQNSFKNYLKNYGTDWVNYKVDSLNRTQVKLKTYEEYRGLSEENEKFLIIQSEEITDSYDGKPLHMNATNTRKPIGPQGGNSVAEVLQNNLDAVKKQSTELDVPMIAHVNHPNFYYAISLEDMIALKDERYFEIYNGHAAVHNSGDSIHMSTENMWDMINIAYTSENKPLMYGIATDDAHHYHRKGRQWSNAGRGWIEVRSDSLNPRSLIAAMDTGDFYASTGVELKDVVADHNKLSITVNPEEGVTYEIAFIGYKKGKTEPEKLKTSTGTEASFELTDDLVFIRCKITSSKLHANPIEDLLYETAWTQPVLISKNQ